MTATVAPYDVDRPTPVPSTTIASAPPPQISDAGPRATATAGQMLSDVAQETDRYSLHLDTLQAQDALNKLRAKKEDLTYGPQNGFMNIKGGDVINPNRAGGPVLDDYKTRLQAASDDIASGLSPRARRMYGERYAGELTDFKSSIAKHSIQQTEMFNDQVFKDGATQDATEAMRYVDDPGKLKQIADRAASRTAGYYATKGFDPVQGELAARSQVFSAAISAKLASGDSRGAIAYFNAYKGQLDGRDLSTLQPRITDKTRQYDAESWSDRALPTPQAAAALRGKRNDVIGIMTGSGMPQDDAQAWAANYEHESQFNTGAVNPHDGSDGSDSIGMGQWNGSRAKAFHDFAAKNGLKETDSSTQIKYAQAEINGEIPFSVSGISPDLKAKLATASGPAAKAALLSQEYFKPRGGVGEARNRAATANQYATEGGSAPTDDPLHAYKIQGLKLISDIETDPNIDPEVKARRIQVLKERIGTTDAIYTAERSQAVNDRNTATTIAMTNPALYVPGTFGKLADKQRAAGDFAEAERSDYLQAHESELLGFAKLPPGELKNALAHTMGGVGGKIAQSMVVNDHQRFTELRKEAHDADVAFTKGVSDGLPVGSVIENAREAHAKYAAVGDRVNMQRIETQIQSLIGGENVAKLPPGQAASVLRDMRERATNNGFNAQESMLFDAATKAVAKQQQSWKDDPLATFASLRPDMMPAGGNLPPVDLTMPPQQLALALRSRADIANRAGHYIDPNTSAPNVPLLTSAEIGQWSKTLQTGTVPARQQMLSSLGQALPPEQMPLVARKLAGNDNTAGAWATALSFYHRNQPGDREIADSILAGANRWLEGGPEGKERIKLDATNWLPVIDGTLGHSRATMDGRSLAAQNAAIGARYVSLMGSQDPAKLDTSVLQKAIKDIVGEKATIHGGDILLPSGVADWQWRDGLQNLSDKDLPALPASAGKPITAQTIKDNATFESVGDGLYHVWLPDPKRGATVKLTQADNGKPYVLDIRPLIARGGGSDGALQRMGVMPQGIP